MYTNTLILSSMKCLQNIIGLEITTASLSAWCVPLVEGQGDGTCWICTHKHPVITRPTFPGNAPRTSSSSLYRPQVYQLSNRVIYGHLSPWRVKVAPYLSQMEDSTSLVTYLSAASSGLQIFRCTLVHLRISTNLKSLSTGLSQTYLH